MQQVHGICEFKESTTHSFPHPWLFLFAWTSPPPETLGACSFIAFNSVQMSPLSTTFFSPPAHSTSLPALFSPLALSSSDTLGILLIY